ncbi:MAG: hypothetical protein JF603_14450 [Acidobacteria bacterium]|nr:hypothetical protein [Acidobacteriota bacterium]
MSAAPAVAHLPAPEEGRPRRARRRLVAIVVLATLATSGIAAGTWASFTASTSNNGSFATGALILSNKVNSGTACLSIGADTFTDTNANAGCDALFAIDTTKPGDAATSAAIVLENVGNVAASSLGAYSSSACATDDAPSTTFHGTGNLCSAVQITIKSYTSQANLDSDDPTGGTCLYGVDVDGSDGICDGFSSSATLATFSSTYPSFTSALPLGAIQATAQRYYRLSARLDPAATNTAQGRRATFGITWRMVQ